MPTEIIRKPVNFQPKQFTLLKQILRCSPQAPTVLGYGGSRGAAKSGGVRRIAATLASSFPNEKYKFPVTIWIMRRVWDDLNKDHVIPMWEDFPDFKQHYHAGEKKIVLPNGSTIFFIHAGDSGRAKRKARGPQAHFIFLEQAEEFSQAEMEQLAGSNRAPGVPVGFCKRIHTFNPGGVGTNYLRRIFHLREFRDNERPENFSFIQAYGWDNFEWFRATGCCTEQQFYNEWPDKQRFDTFITKTDFGRKLNELPQNQRIGELLGSFENFAGQYFAEVWEQKSIVLPVDVVMRIVKPWWPRWMATDWGFSHYAATGWCTAGLLTVEEIWDYFRISAVAPVRVLVVYREAVVSDLGEPDLARLLTALTPPEEAREVRYHFMGHDAWAKRGSAHTVVDQMDPVFTTQGLPRLVKADIDRAGGWRLLWNCFAAARRLRTAVGPFEERADDQPALFISAACTEICSAIPTLISDYDPITEPNGNPQDVRKMPGQMSDDVADMLRYLIKSFLRAEPGMPLDTQRAETYQKYQDPTARAMAMLRLEADSSQRDFIRRKRRA